MRFILSFLLGCALAWGLCGPSVEAVAANATSAANATKRAEDPVMRPSKRYGTVNEGLNVGRDPVTGDRVIQVTPPPKPEEENQDTDVAPLIIIRPGKK